MEISQENRMENELPEWWRILTGGYFSFKPSISALLRKLISLLKVLLKYWVKKCANEKRFLRIVGNSDTRIKRLWWDQNVLTTMVSNINVSIQNDFRNKNEITHGFFQNIWALCIFFKTSPMKGNGKIPFQYQYMSPKRTIQQKKYYVGELTALLVKLKLSWIQKWLVKNKADKVLALC